MFNQGKRFFLILLSIELCYSNNCPIYINKEFDTPEKCYQITVDSEVKCQFHQCPKGKHCAIENDGLEGLCKDFNKTKYPGEICSFNDECMIGECKNNICEIASHLQYCLEDINCNYGEFCHKTEEICKKVKNYNDQCISGDRCNSGLVCNNSKCIPMGTLDENSPVDASSACKTLYSHDGFCTKGPTLNKSQSGDY